MKNIGLLVFSLVLFSLSVQAQINGTRELSSFNEVVVYGDIQVVMVKGTVEKVEITVEGTELENVITEVGGNKLKIKLKANLFQEKEVNVKVYYKELEGLKAIAGAEIRTTETIKAKHLVLQAISAGKIRGDFDVYSIDVKASQGGVLNLKGKAETQNVHAGTGGTYDAYDLISRDIVVEAYTGAIVKVNTTKMLNAFASSGANISFMGNPEVKSRKSNLGGKINDISESGKEM